MVGEITSDVRHVYLHGLGSSGAKFRAHWPEGVAGEFLDGPEFDLLSRERRWFAFTMRPDALAKRIKSAAVALEERLSSFAVGHELELHCHSQGAMIGLEIVRAGRIRVRAIDAYAGFLPAELLASGVERQPRARPTTVELWSSAADCFIHPSQVRETFTALASSLVVRHYSAKDLPHGFATCWLDRSRFEEVGDEWCSRWS